MFHRARDSASIYSGRGLGGPWGSGATGYVEPLGRPYGARVGRRTCARLWAPAGCSANRPDLPESDEGSHMGPAANVSIDPRVMLGKPVIHGTRVMVKLVLRKLSEGATEADILDAHPIWRPTTSKPSWPTPRIRLGMRSRPSWRRLRFTADSAPRVFSRTRVAASASYALSARPATTRRPGHRLKRAEHQ